MREKFLITGALGCIGSWILRQLSAEEVGVVAVDIAEDRSRPQALLSSEQLSRICFVRCDITDAKRLQELIRVESVTHVVHLAALQVPFCKADPSLGAKVNVTGTVNLFEAVRHNRGQVRGLCYASSIAVLGPASAYARFPVSDSAPRRPATLYGAYKKLNEDVARIYWSDWKVPSVGLRPYIVFGAGRDQGMTSDITKAIFACAAGERFHIQFDGPVVLHYAADVARMCICAARSEYQGAVSCNLREHAVSVAEFVEFLQGMFPKGRITYERNKTLPFPGDLDDTGLRSIIGEIPLTSLEAATLKTYEHFRRLLNDSSLASSETGGGPHAGRRSTGR